MERNYFSLDVLKKEFSYLNIISDESQNIKYEGLIVEAGAEKEKIRSRLAKKNGYFVAFWEKNSDR